MSYEVIETMIIKKTHKKYGSILPDVVMIIIWNKKLSRLIGIGFCEKIYLKINQDKPCFLACLSYIFSLKHKETRVNWKL